jgi:hypothetical protein
MKPNTSQDTSWTWLQRAQGPKHEAVKLQGPGQKMLKLARQGTLSKPWRRRHQGPTCIREQVNNWPRSIGERDGAEPGQNGPGPAGPAWSEPGLRPPFALGACLFISSASAGRHIHPFIREPLRRRRSTGRKPESASRPLSGFWWIEWQGD